MRSNYKRIIISLIFIQVIIGEPCPSMCNGHGACSLGGVCNCFPGWVGSDCRDRTCPYGHSFVDPTTVPGDHDSLINRASLECSGQGSCDREQGKCICYPGYEGASCNRVSCPNNCNKHGVCTAVKMTDLDKNTHINSFYITDLKKLPSHTSSIPTKSSVAYEGWDLDQSFACVCDGEYTGYDCSEKKCPRGYTINSECDTPAESIQTITIGSTGAGAPTFYDATPPSTDGVYNCMTYLEYTDMYNRVWYSDAFCVLCQSKGSTTITEPKINIGTPQNEVNFCDNVLGWEEALGRLPVGTIDASVNIKLKDKDDNESGDAQKITKVVATISFGSQQTGRQKPIGFITETDLQGSNLYAEVNGKSGSGYHGMTINQLTLDKTGQPTTKDSDKFYTPLIKTIITPVVVTGISPLECSRHGTCDRTTGLCECFEGYYGLACTEQASIM